MLFIGYNLPVDPPAGRLPIDRAANGGKIAPHCNANCSATPNHTASYWGVNWDGYVDEKPSASARA